MRFVFFVAGSGVPAIKDTLNGKMVCAFFRDKRRPEATEAMMDVCLKALNAAVERAAKKDGSHV